MNDATLYELAVKLVAADIQCGVIGPAVLCREEQIKDRIAFYHDMLREQWRERHHVENIEPFPHDSR